MTRHDETMKWPNCPDCGSAEYVEFRWAAREGRAVVREWTCADCGEPFTTTEGEYNR